MKVDIDGLSTKQSNSETLLRKETMTSSNAKVADIIPPPLEMGDDENSSSYRVHKDHLPNCKKHIM